MHSLMVVVGLGNPGCEYSGTRHNVGFMVADRLAERFGKEIKECGFKGLFGIVELGGKEVVLAKPLTFMNQSGECTKELLNYFKLTPSSLIIIHDDLDLSLGSLKVKFGGGSGGHNGVESLIASLGSDEFGRIRVGIGRPTGRQDPAKFVLKPFTKKQWKEIDIVLEHAADAVESIICSGYESAMRKYN